MSCDLSRMLQLMFFIEIFHERCTVRLLECFSRYPLRLRGKLSLIKFQLRNHLGVERFKVRCSQNSYELPSASADGIEASLENLFK